MPHPDMNEFWTTGHPNEGLLHEWLDEQLSASDAAAIAAHVARCPACSAAVAEARGLIAASHRILSALDEVPAGVIPQNMQHAPESSEATLDFAGRAKELLASRAAASSAREIPARSNTRWRQAGRIAALLFIAIAPAVYFLRGNDVPVKPGVAPAASGPAADFAAAEPLAKSAATADRSAGNPSVAAAPAVPRQLRDDAAMQNAAERRVASAPSVGAVAITQASAPSVEAAKMSASNTAAKAEEVSPPSAASPMLSGRVAGVAVAPQDRARSSSVGATDERTSSTIPLAASPPVPQVANASAPVAQGAARTQSPDTLGSAQAIAAAVRRASDAEAIRETAPMAARAQLRSDFSATTTGTPFDSVVMTRTNCATSCETSVVHVTPGGAVRFTVSSGSSRSVPVLSQLSVTERNGLRQVILAALPNAFTAPASTHCTVGRPSGAPLLDLLIARTPPGIVERGEASLYRCAADGALIRLGATIDSIVRTNELRRRMP